MIRQILTFCTTFFFGVGVMLISIYSSVIPESKFYAVGEEVEGIVFSESGYSMPGVGMIAPDSPFWPIVALTDSLRVRFTTSEESRSLTYLSYADRRLVQSNYLLGSGEYAHAALVLRRAEMYLEQSYNSYLSATNSGENTEDLSRKIMTVSVVHSDLIAESLLKYPEETRPDVIETMNYSRRIFGVLSNKNSDESLRSVSSL